MAWAFQVQAIQREAVELCNTYNNVKVQVVTRLEYIPSNAMRMGWTSPSGSTPASPATRYLSNTSMLPYVYACLSFFLVFRVNNAHCAFVTPYVARGMLIPMSSNSSRDKDRCRERYRETDRALDRGLVRLTYEGVSLRSYSKSWYTSDRDMGECRSAHTVSRGTIETNI